jgi:hypothetical protein
MPDAYGALTPAENAQVAEWFRTHWNNYSCPFSGPATQWQVSPHIVALSSVSVGEAGILSPVLAGATAYPVIQITCAHCGYTVFFNAITMGIVPGRIAVRQARADGG